MVHGLPPPGRDRVRGRDDLVVEGRPEAVRPGALGAPKGAPQSAFKREASGPEASRTFPKDGGRE